MKIWMDNVGELRWVINDKLNNYIYFVLKFLVDIL